MRWVCVCDVDWMQAVQAMMIISLIFIVAFITLAILGKAGNRRCCVCLAVVLGILAGNIRITVTVFTCKAATNSSSAAAADSVVAMVTGILAITSYIVFAYKSQHPKSVTDQLFIGWSFYLASVGSFILLIATAFLALVCARSTYEPLKGDVKKSQGQGYADTEKAGGNY